MVLLNSSENCKLCDLQTLCHPASVDSLSTSAGTEDHVSMGGFAARKCLQVRPGADGHDHQVKCPHVSRW